MTSAPNRSLAIWIALLAGGLTSLTALASLATCNPPPRLRSGNDALAKLGWLSGSWTNPAVAPPSGPGAGPD